VSSSQRQSTTAFFQAPCTMLCTVLCTAAPAMAISGDHHHITTARQELILPSQCTYPPRPAVDARLRVALVLCSLVPSTSRPTSAALHPSGHPNLDAARNLPSVPICPSLSLALLISALAEPRSLLPILISWWGCCPCPGPAVHCTWQSDLQGAARLPDTTRESQTSPGLSRRPRHMTTVPCQHEKFDFFFSGFTLERTSTLQVGFSVR
jgi:hypothetical protein